MQIKGNNFLVAKELLEKGWNPIPIKNGEKSPVVQWQQFQEKRVTLEDITEWFYETDHEIAVVTGKLSGITVIDLDKKENIDGKKTAIAQGLDLPVAAVRKSPNGIHHYIKYNPNIKQTQGILDGIDIRNDGGYIKFWDFKGKYHWLDDSDPIDYTHEKLIKKISSSITNAVATSGNRPPDVATVQIPKGKRHPEIIKVVAKLKKGGFTLDEAINHMRSWNQTYCNPPESEYVLVTQVNDIYMRGTFQAPEEWNIQDLSEATAEAVDWLFHPFILKNHLNVLAGKQGDGKTTFALKLLLDMVHKNQLPYGATRNEDINVMFLSKEDTSARLKERALQMGYKLPPGRVFFVDSHTDLTDPIDQEKLIQNLKKYKINFLVLDPLTSYIGDGSPDESKIVRPYLEFMNKSIAVDVDVTVLGLAHFNKDTQQNSLYRLRGSGAWSEVPRQVIYLAQDEEKQTGLSYIWIQKSNYVSSYDKSAKIRMKMSNSGRVEIDSDIPDELDVVELLKTNQKPKKKQDQAKDFILDMLGTSGAITWDQVIRKSPQTMMGKTLEKARADLTKDGMIQKQKIGMHETLWSLTELANPQIYPVGKKGDLLNEESQQMEINLDLIEEEYKL